MTGYLELIIGPMFSGKTSKLLEIYKQCKFCNIEVTIINHSLDTRYDETMLSSHDKRIAPCIRASNLSDVDFENADVILINEGQFFEDLYESVIRMVNNNKKVYVCGLDGDFERNPMGKILNLIPYCDKVTKLTSMCAICRDGTPGIFSKRLTHDNGQILVGVNNYEPVCRMHF
jgi:thymidine kinase